MEWKSVQRPMAALASVMLLGALLGSGRADASADAQGSPARVAATPTSQLQAVSADSSTDAWVVGWYFNGTQYKTLTKHWDGAAWDEKGSANPGGADGSFFYGVSALSPTDAWAVGNYFLGSSPQTLVQHWDGSKWTQSPSPTPAGAVTAVLSGVSAVSATDVWAVGSYTLSTGTDKTLIEHWDGSTWSTVKSPNPGSALDVLNGVSAVSAKDAWAVGNHNKYKTMILHWNGKKWTQSASPNPGKKNNTLNGVSAVSATDAWVVGQYDGSKRTLIEHWDGDDWTVTASPDPGGQAHLVGVSAWSAGEAWAVGTHFSSALGHDVTLIEHWDGASWTIVPGSDPDDSIGTELLSVSTTSATDAWATGYYATAARHRPLVEHWDGVSWTQS